MRRLLILLAAPLLLAWLPTEPSQQSGPWTMRQTGRVATVPGITSFACDSDSCDWTSYGAETCVGSQDVGSDFSTSGATSGTDAVTQAETTVYTLTCTSVAGTAIVTDEVVVGGGGEASILNNEAENIFDIYGLPGSLCDPAETPANGITFCEGAEDGEWFPDGSGDSCGAGCDYYSKAGFIPDDPAAGSVTGANAYTMCNTGTIDPDVADFGAAGTPCTLTKGWVDRATNTQSVGGRVDGFHTLINAGTAGTFDSAGTSHWSMRFYIKFAGATTARCGTDTGADAGSSCSPPPAFIQRGPNGPKGMVWQNVTSYSGGLGLQSLDIWNAGGTYSGSEESPGNNWNINAGWNDGSPLTTEGERLEDNGNPPDGVTYSANYAGIDSTAYEVDWRNPTYADHWWFVEVHHRGVDVGDATYPAGGLLRIYMRPCGKDGLGCPPTDDIADFLYAERIGWDLAYNGTAGAANVRSIWINYWNRGQTGEIQIDELVFRDREIVDADIGFAPRAGIEFTLP